ncbi:MAG: Eco57I restriction-modification methylase domain-containing protein [Xanthomonadales bacterium]|nr:Eco57I restriction-modification methylase domain-containing protein [Xanthomonadales bacterium]
MNSLLDVFGSAHRAADINAALDLLAGEAETERGAVFTRPEVAAAIVDLAGYTADRPLHRLRLLEPAFGKGDFLLLAVERLLEAWRRDGGVAETALSDLTNAVRAVELHRESVDEVRSAISERLRAAGIDTATADVLCARWLVCDDFLLSHLPGEFDVVVGNPPYVRQERIPAALLAEYRSRFRTLFDRADLYIPFYERALDLLGPGGRLGFICANRWIKNRYGGPLRAKIGKDFALLHFVDMEGVDAFQSEVIAYPAITVIERPNDPSAPRVPTRVTKGVELRRLGLSHAVQNLLAPRPQQSIEEIALSSLEGDGPWLLDDLPRLRLLRRLESSFPLLEEAGCKVGIGVATGCDRVFIDDLDDLPVEPERKLPLVMARDLVQGRIRWNGKGIVNPFEADGSLADLERYPRFASYLYRHYDAVAGRHVAKRSGEGWYRTIDRIYPELVGVPKLLVPDIKGEATFVIDEGRYYPHHNLYFITSRDWDLRALRCVLRSSLSVMIVATYCTKMAGGFLRFQAQYLRRIRLPHWTDVSEQMRDRLIALADDEDTAALDRPVFELFGLSQSDGELVQQIATQAQVTSRNNRAQTE